MANKILKTIEIGGVPMDVHAVEYLSNSTQTSNGANTYTNGASVTVTEKGVYLCEASWSFNSPSTTGTRSCLLAIADSGRVNVVRVSSGDNSVVQLFTSAMKIVVSVPVTFYAQSWTNKACSPAGTNTYLRLFKIIDMGS